MGKFEQLARANQVFTPGSPVQQKDLFSGRAVQLERALQALAAPGRHPVIFGQRGVGKTSLANILGQGLQGFMSVKISCDSSDTFVTIWNRVLYSASVKFKQKAFGFTHAQATKTITLGEALDHDPSVTKPAEIADLFCRLQSYCVIILDEFDKVADVSVKSAFADLIKILSDNAPRVTVVFVGVAENIHELVGEHPSIDRNLVQIELPLMSEQEIRTIFETGFQKLDLEAEPGAIQQVPTLAGGFPHYAHLLGFCAAKVCAENGVTKLTLALFDVACNLAVEDAIEKYRDAYAKATATTQPSRYPLILSACGYAQTDSRGVFRATDVVDAIQEVFNARVTIQAIVPALGEFLNERRGAILKAVKVGGRQCYRFKDPMMRPFCRLRARDILLARQSMS